MTERYVLEALQKAVITATSSLSLDVKYLGRVFKTPDDGKWLEIVYIPNNIENEFWGSVKTYRGFMRLILHWPIDDTGVYEALDMVNNVADGFIKGSKFTDSGENVLVKITDNPNISSVLEEPPEILIPLTIRYSYLKI